MYVCAYWPVHLELRALRSGSQLRFIAFTALAALALELVARRVVLRRSVDASEELSDDLGDITVLDIGRVIEGAHVGR